jgi:hypothetical protein
MKKLLTSFFVISSIVLSPAIHAQDAPPPSEGTPVGQAASDGVSAAKKKRWQNIALAAGAVAVAVTALVLIANNDGHSSHHKASND